MRILRECDCTPSLSSSKPIVEKLCIHIFGQRIGISECDIWLVRCSLRINFVQHLAHLLTLIFGPFPDRRATSDICVLFLDFGRSSLSDERSDVCLKSPQRNKITVGLWKKEIKISHDPKERRNPRTHTNSLLRKGSTSSVVDGPPMFMKTMAVGPFDPVASWVTGGTTVASPDFWFPLHPK